MAACAVTSVMAADPQFQALKKAYGYMKYSDDHLAQVLQLCREHYNYSDDWYPETPAQKGVFTRFIKFYLPSVELADTSSELRRDSVYNLYSTLYGLYSPEQLESRINMIARDFSQLVDILQANDKTNRSRYELIRAEGNDKENGYVVLMRRLMDIYKQKYSDADRMMESFDKKYPNIDPQQRESAYKTALYRAKEYNKILENKDRFAAIVASKIGETEGFSINNKSFAIPLDDATVAENQMSEGEESTENEYQQDAEESSKGDRYDDFRSRKLLDTLSVKVRRIINKIPKIDSAGNLVRDDLGVVQTIDGRQVAAVLKKVLAASNPDSMMTVLQNATDFYPWINGIIKVLERDSDARTSIYDAFKSAETTYVYVSFENGTYKPHIANTRSAGNVLMREAGNNLSSGFIVDEANSIYTGYGALRSYDSIQEIAERFDGIRKLIQSNEGLRLIRMVSGDSPANKKRIEDAIESGRKEGKDLSYLRENGEAAVKGFLDKNPNVAGEIASYLRGMGFVVRERDIAALASQTIAKKSFRFIAGNKLANASIGRNKLYQLVDAMQGVYSRIGEIHRANGTWTGQFLYNTTEAFRRINSIVSLTQYKEVEPRVISGNKSLSTYNNVNLLHQVFDDLTNKDLRSEEQYQEDLKNNFSRYEGMSLGFNDNLRETGWLSMLKNNTLDLRDNLRVIDISEFNHVEYARMTREQKLTNSIVMYFNGGNLFLNDNYAAYEYPIQADYSTAYNFVVAPKLHGATLDDSSEIVNALTDEVLIELERIASIQARVKVSGKPVLGVYEEQGLKLQIFPALNDTDFIKKYSETTTADEARDFVRQNVIEQLKDVVAQDYELINNSKILSNSAFKDIDLGYGNRGSLYAEDGNTASLSEEARASLEECFLNVFYARQQMIKLVTGGMEQFDGLMNYEKRNMMSHATRTSLYTKATWKGEPVGKESQKVVYIEDDESASAFLSDIKDMLHQLLEEKIITGDQYKTMLKSYSSITTTDGQGLRTLDSYRTVMIMADQWDDRHESAYKNIKRGNPTKDDIDIFMQNIKPVLTGFEHIEAAEGDMQKPIRLTVLHKYSEMVLLPLSLYKYSLPNRSVPMQALEKANEELGNDIDMFLFHSGVKVGGHSILTPFKKDEKTGERIINKTSDITNYIVNAVQTNKASVHILPFKYYGIAASTPVHIADDKIAWASQAEKVAWANINPGDVLLIRGQRKSATEARELYHEIKAVDIMLQYTDLRKLFANPSELERILQEELADKSYSSRELVYALSHIKDGDFALPLFSPNIEHQVQELFASIIKRRLTKPKVKGANVLQSTSLGVDIEASAFDNNNALSEKDKLQIVFDGEGKDKRIKYVEVYMPIHDSRLKQFADDNGNINPDRLAALVKNGTIPEEILNFIAYRTPSDAEHSVIPCRIKGFIANVAGATIRMPKEIMVMTGHDYDGDKMRCHFADFKVEWNKAWIEDLYNDRVSELTSDEEVPPQLKSFENFYAWYTSENNTVYEQQAYKKISYIAYDYDKSPIENSQIARNNARVEMMFAQLTSPEGSRRVLIPGGCDDTKVVAKALYLVRSAREPAVKERIKNRLVEQGMTPSEANKSVNNSSELYDVLVNKSNKQLTSFIKDVSSTEVPYTLKHSTDAFDYIMGGAELIGIYALYNSALQMMQRLDIQYRPKVSAKNVKYDVTLFNNRWDRMFNIKNHDGKLASLGLARMLNAAVDNNKDPVLGYLNQTKEMSEMTFLLFAAGQTEEEVHLIMNQPAVIKLIDRLKARDSSGFISEAGKLIKELEGDIPVLSDIANLALGQKIGIDNVSKMSKSDFTSALDKTFEEIKQNRGEIHDRINQMSILQTLIHLEPAASSLSTFVRLTRPESESGSIGTSVADIIAKESALNNFRKRINDSENTFRFTGIGEVLEWRNVFDGWGLEYAEKILGTSLPEVVALNSLMLDSSLNMLEPFFPQAKASWVQLEEQLASKYQYKSLQEGTIKKIGNEMILWKLLSNKKFVQGDPQVEQKHILVNVPKFVQVLKQRINKAASDPEAELEMRRLVDNAFINNLGIYPPQSSDSLPRLQFRLNGPAVEGTADMIRSYWNSMLNDDTVITTYKDEEGLDIKETVHDLAIDLFKYNLYTNGFSYGMYEFSHFAPFSVLMETPGYINALQDVLKSNWDDDRERENFIDYYYMNHWGDSKFLPTLSVRTLSLASLPTGVSGQLWISNKTAPATIDAIKEQRYIVITSGEKNETQTLYKVHPGNADAAVILSKAVKLGSRNDSQQMTVQYNPSVDPELVTPVVAGNDSAWGDLSTDMSITSLLSSANPMDLFSGIKTDPIFGIPLGSLPSLSMLGIEEKAKEIEAIEEKAESAIESNDSTINKIEESNPTEVKSTEEIIAASANIFSFGGPVDTEALRASIRNVSSTDDDSANTTPLLSIVHKDLKGNIVTDKVKATPYAVSLARKQKVLVELNKRLRDILRSKGVSVGTLLDAEARLSISGISDFDTASVTAEGLLELIRIAQGYEGEQALPEEFAHVALEMLGHDHPLVKRLLDVLRSNQDAVEEAFDGMYQEYENTYGVDNREKLILEAAGKLVARQLLYQEEVKSKPVKSLLSRIIEAIKNLFKKFSIHEVQNAIFDANDIASKVARDILGGRLLDQMSLVNAVAEGQYYKKVQKDLTDQQGILTKLLKNEVKKLAVFKKRLGPGNTTKSSAVDMTENEISKLEAAIKNHKSEEAVVTYLNDTMDILKLSWKSLEDAENSGRPMNSICRKLNTIRDTLYSVSTAIQDIRKAISEKEIQDTVGITQTMGQVSEVLERFFVEYNTLAMEHFETMLSSVYGEHGKTITVGKNKGKVVSISEMARRADCDISFASRWFNSVADCNDYVLKAIDDVVRNAKMRARKRTLNIRPRIEVAVAKLKEATGSTDQSFMFKYEKGTDGKEHRTGKYIDAATAKDTLNTAQWNFYKEIMEIKKTADACLPESLIKPDNMIMLRKSTMEKFKAAEGAKGKALAAWDGLKNRVLDMSDDIDYDNYEVAKDFEGNRVDTLPVKFLMKGKHESYDDMSDDVATSLMAYSGMAYEYGELNNVIGVIENAKYMASQREVVQKTGTRTQRETVETDDYKFKETFTVKQARTRIQEALEDFIQMHVYGHIHANEGTFGRTRVSKRKVVDTINNVVSLSQMAINLPQRIANVSTGTVNIIIESSGNGAYNAKDVSWATSVYIKESGDRLAETGKTDYSNKLSLWDEYFDVHQDNGRSQTSYKKGRMSRIFNSSLLYAGLTIGEDYLATVTSLAAARNFKVKDPAGNPKTLWDAYKVSYADAEAKSGAFLELIDGYTKMDGTPITPEDEAKFAKQVAGLNFELQGIYNLDDRSAVQKHAFGALIIMYRKWIAPALKRRYSSVQYNVLKDQYQEGYHRTLGRLLLDSMKDAKEQISEKESAECMMNIIADIKALISSCKLNWEKMNDYEKSNVHRSLTELGIVLGLIVSTSLLTKLPPPDEEDDRGKFLTWWDSTLTSQLLRLRTEIGSQAPTPMLVDEALKVLRSPFAAIGPLQDALNMFQLLLPSNYFEEVKAGRYKGHSKAYKYFRELPIVSMAKKVDNFIDPSPMINYYKNDLSF